jgi:hypothetical protein
MINLLNSEDSQNDSEGKTINNLPKKNSTILDD